VMAMLVALTATRRFQRRNSITDSVALIFSFLLRSTLGLVCPS
jgi:hypothetical protein